MTNVSFEVLTVMADEKVETRGSSLFWVTVILPAIAWLLYFGTVAHKLKSSRFGVEDVMLAIGAILLVLQTAAVFQCIHYGFGKHVKDISTHDLGMAFKYFYVMQVFYKPLGCFVKLAFLCLYHRVFEAPRYRRFISWSIAYVAMGTVAFTFASIFQCTPISYNWNKKQKGQCIDSAAFWYTHAVWHVTSDFAVFIMPVPIISKLNMHRSRRLVLIAVFALGLFTCIASIIRMTTLLQSSKSNEPTWGSFEAMKWTQIDSCMSVTCACLPTLRKPFSDLMHRLGFPRTVIGNSNYPLGEIHSSNAQSNRHTVWDTSKKEWFDERDVYHARMHNSRRPSLSNESVVGIVRTTDVEILRSSGDGSAQRSDDSHHREHDSGRRVNVV